MNPSVLEESGERVDVIGRPRTHTEQDHRARYAWAAKQVRGDVLDAACGTGHGSMLLAQRARVWGLDNNEGAVALARTRVPDGSFVVAELPRIPYPADSFDAVVSFETIEHIGDDAGFVDEIARVLRPGGLVLLSTPNREVTSPGGVIRNPWHAREYVLAELVSMLERGGFHQLEIHCQGVDPRSIFRRHALRVVARFPTLCRPGRWWDRLAHGDGSVEHWRPGEVPTIWVIKAISRRASTS